MTKPSLLKLILDICYFFLIMAFLGAIFLGATMWLEGTLLPLEFGNQEITETTPLTVSLFCAEIIIGALTVYTVYTLRKLIRNFLKGRFFTEPQVTGLSATGKLIILVTLSQGIVEILANLVLAGNENLKIELDLSFGSFWFILAIGLFFLYLSKIFENARLLKEDNELTV